MFSYSQSTGVLTNDAGNVLGTGYAGQPPGLNDPTRQDQQGVGPLPQGIYTIGEPHNAQTTGRVTMNLDPDDGNEMFGRSLFRMHGDNAAMNHTASDGCIIMGLAVRLEVAEACGWRVSLIPEFAVAEVTPTSEGKIQVVG